MPPVPAPVTEKRRYLSPSEKARVIDRQRGICACGCGEALEVGHIRFDHRRPLSMGGTNDISNFDALKAKHHQAKTNKEATERARADRLRAKHNGTWLKPRDRALAAILARTKQI